MSVQRGSSQDLGPVAPDGGWGWVVLLAAFLFSVIVDGICFSFGIFYLEFLDHFGDNKGTTAWVGSVLNGTYMIMGPVAGALANKFGCRAVAVAGSVWAAVAFFLSTYSRSVGALITTYGILGGMGFGLMYLPSIVIVGFYFDKKRAFATGLATCGSGVGAFIFAPMCKALIDIYAWRGAMWLLAGLVLNGIVLGALFRPVTFKELEKVRRKQLKHQQDKEKTKTDPPELEDEFHKARNGPVATDPGSLSSVEETASLNAYKNVDDSREKTLFLKNGTASNLRFRPNSGSGPIRQGALGDSWHSLSGLAASMDQLDQAPTARPAASPAQSCLALVKDVVGEVQDTMDVSMLRDPVFVVYGFSCILCMADMLAPLPHQTFMDWLMSYGLAGFFVPFIYLPDNAIGLGYSAQQGAFLLSILGITNTLGRIAAGWLSDRPWADCLVINNCALVLGGLATALCPLCTNYTALVIYSCVFGLCIAAFVSLRSIILVDLIGLERLTNAFGLIVLCQGITSFVGAPFAGWLFDITGTYDVSFYVAGTAIALAGLICFPLRRLSARMRQQDNCRSRDVTNPKDCKDIVVEDLESSV